jgi:hypothetical protein
VTVVWRTGPKPPEEGPGAEAPPPPDLLKGRYADPKTTTIRRTVPQGGGEIEAIKLN